ncbi:hypothetical protein NE619_17880 [Anaerovorax odorimutans]|uniref:Uncharacterized protein n=1 Tax=Anaerovorax odorimutans TaxID=109327 RepID=A0ABT1RTR1_9FIRM|nr:hypothetical protein [Anaerovorax odorimutans]MCQ4638602.1 hypothetical protein [Anaerovorax odorimutans]
MTKDEFNTKIWQFYLQLEDDFYSTLRYVEFSNDNFSTYSKEYTKQLLSIGSEVDIVCKALCERVNADAQRKNITDYAKILCGYNGLTDAKVSVNLTKEEFIPFAGWSEADSPFWWKAYNEIKHGRLDDDNHKKGSLKNVYTTLAGLFVLNRYLCKDICRGKTMQEPEECSKLFKMVGWPIRKSLGSGFMQAVSGNGNLSLIHE